MDRRADVIAPFFLPEEALTEMKATRQDFVIEVAGILGEAFVKGELQLSRSGEVFIRDGEFVGSVQFPSEAVGYLSVVSGSPSLGEALLNVVSKGVQIAGSVVVTELLTDFWGWTCVSINSHGPLSFVSLGGPCP